MSRSVTVRYRPGGANIPALMDKPVPMPRRNAPNASNPPVAKIRTVFAQPSGGRVATPVIIRNKPRADKTSFLDRVMRVISSSLNNPMVLTLIGIILAVMVSHLNDPTGGPLATFIKGLAGNDSTKALAEWLKANLTRFLGFLTFLPAIFAVPKKDRTMVLVASVIWIFVAPAASYYQYAYQAIILLLFYRLNRAQDRAILVVSVIALQFMGIKFIPSLPGTVATGKTH